jgi:hypothetical protein
MKYLLLLGLCLFCGFRTFVQKPNIEAETSSHIVITPPRHVGGGMYFFSSEGYTVNLERFLRSHQEMRGVEVKKTIGGYNVTFEKKD